MSIDDKVRQIIKAECIKQKITLNAVTRKAGVDNAGVWRFMNPTKPRSIRLDMVAKLFKVLNLPMGVLDE